MKGIAVLTLLVVSGAAGPMPAKAQGASTAENDRKAEKLAQKQQTAIFKYQRAQQKAQEKAQRKADKKQAKAQKKYEKEQQKLLKNANRPAKHTT
jgi:hypothetical protein